MKNILQNKSSAFFWLRGCCICRASTPPIYWLCVYCWKKLNKLYLSPQNMIRNQNGITHLRLFDWCEENDIFIRLFLKSLKQGGPGFIFKKLVSDFLYRSIQSYPISKNMVVVPAPSSIQYYDHSFCLASPFASSLGLKLHNILIKNKFVENQKQKTKSQRREISFCLKKNILLDKVIFIDDILTTGATAQAVYKALNKPKDFIIFTLSWRHLNTLKNT